MRKLGMTVLLLALTAACSGTTTPSAQKTTQSPSVSPSPSPCVGKGAHISLPCPIKEFGTTDLSAQGTDVRATFTTGDVSFDPTFVKIKPGAHVTLVLDATGSYGLHNFIIDTIGLKENLSGSTKTTVSFTLPASGPVRFYCSIHVAQGMQGAFYFS
jgi:plastocyanin